MSNFGIILPMDYVKRNKRCILSLLFSVIILLMVYATSFLLYPFELLRLNSGQLAFLGYIFLCIIALSPVFAILSIFKERKLFGALALLFSLGTLWLLLVKITEPVT
jgi:hypothetical protein